MYQFTETLSAALEAGNPQRVLLEFSGKTFTNEDIAISNGVELTADFNSETNLTIGMCPSANLRFDLLNDQYQLSDFEFGTFKAWLGARIDSGTPTGKTVEFQEGGKTVTYEFAPLGTFIATRPDVVRKTIISVDANDQMILFDEDMPTASALGITYPITLAALAKKLCDYVGVSLKTQSFLNANISVSSEPEQFETATMREVLGWIAEAACSNARFTRDGLLEFAWFTVIDKEYDETNYSDFMPSWYETQAINGLHIRNADSTSEISLGQNSNVYMIQDNPFLRQPD